MSRTRWRPFAAGYLTRALGLDRLAARSIKWLVIGVLFLIWWATHTTVGAAVAIVLLVVAFARLGGARLPRGSISAYGPRVRTAVYWMYGDRGELLYVGIAVDPERRWRQHQADPGKQHWIWRVTDREVRWYDSRQEAKAVETEVITGQRGPRPYYNKAENEVDA